MTDQEIEAHVWKAVRKTINKFREHPYYFFTESDIISYLWMSLYSKGLEARTKDAQSVYCVHREYPTNFRYFDKELLDNPRSFPLTMKAGARGHYDLVVLKPSFVSLWSMAHIVNKNVRHLEERYADDQYASTAEELLFAFEFKYVTNRDVDWDREVRKDNQKLVFAKKHNVRHAVNLVFCNLNTRHASLFELAVKQAPPTIDAVWVQAHYDGGVKKAPTPIPNTPQALGHAFR